MKKLIGIIILVVTGLFWIAESRSFYYNEDKSKCITVWKRIGGECFIFPYKYNKPWIPKRDFISTSNVNSLTIVWQKKKPDLLVVVNNYGLPITLNFNSIKTKFYDLDKRKEFVNIYYVNQKIKADFEYFTIDIKENLVILNGKVY